MAKYKKSLIHLLPDHIYSDNQDYFPSVRRYMRGWYISYNSSSLIKSTFRRTKDYPTIDAAVMEVLQWPEVSGSDIIPIHSFTKFVLVEWPESQYLMDKKRFGECILVDSMTTGLSSAYMCPLDLYYEIFGV